MIQFQTKITVADNSGARLVQCIKVLKKNKYAGVGDHIVVAIKKAIPDSSKHGSAKPSKGGSKTGSTSIKKGEVHKAIVIRTKAPIRNFNGSQILFEDNAVVILNNKLEPVATRIIGPVSRDLRKTKMTKLLSLAPIVC